MEIIHKFSSSIDKFILFFLRRLPFEVNYRAAKVFLLLYTANYLWKLSNLWFRQINSWDHRGKVVLVTGASRGVGRGIAIELGRAGAIVYITGRTFDENDKNELPGTLSETAKIIRELGGVCIPVKCDHANDEEVKAVFDKIEKEQLKLDVLVNNVFNIPDKAKQSPPFWEQEVSVYDSYMDVGARSHYVAAKYAVPLMLKNKDEKVKGIIVNISSAGGKYYIFNVSYGTCKSALERMSKDMAYELKREGICCLSLWPGLVKTERMIARKETFKKKI